MRTKRGKWLGRIPMLAPRKDSLQDQLNDLYAVALRLGRHDAVQWLQDKGIHRGKQ